MTQPADGRDSPPELRKDLPADMLSVAKDYEFVPFGQ
jgi:hypothetical protein